MTSDKFGKYLLYAAGEIVLVVIGILIALRVNNWNSDRLEKKKEEEILRDLRVEFKANYNDASRVLEGHTSIFHSMYEIQRVADNALSITVHELDSLVYRMFDWFTFTPKPGALESLISSGEIGIISNEEIRENLALWNGVYHELKDDEDMALNFSQSTIVPFLAENYPMSNLEKHDYNTSADGSFSVSDVVRDAIHKQSNDDNLFILRNQKFLSLVAVKKLYAKHNMQECEVVVNHLRTLLGLIEKELETYQ